MCYSIAMQDTLEKIPLEPALIVRATLALHTWLPDGLAQGIVVEAVHEKLPDGTTLSVLGGIPGETVEVEVGWSAIWRAKQRKHPKPPIVRLVRVIHAAPERITPRCPVFGDCGGCRLQHIPYAAQLTWKQHRVAEALAAASLPTTSLLPTLGMDAPWEFRNQMRFAINREGAPGLTAYGTHRVIPLADCPIAHQSINATLAVLSTVSNPRPQVLIRCGAHTGELLVQPAPTGDVAAALTAAQITTRTDGLREELGGLTFAMRPSSFFQTNTAQAEVMAELVMAQIPAGPQTTVADAYCGVGTFAALLAQRAAQVIAIEESASAVRDARDNLQSLGITNVEVHQGRAEVLLPTLTTTIDAIVLDPPRMGCLRPMLDAILTRQIPRVVYVSCDPTTLARDLAILCNDGRYALSSVQPLDMFPQTHHIECVATLDFVGEKLTEK